MSKKRYYLAYGSNLNMAQMQWRCPGAVPLGTAEISGYRLLFKGSRTGSYLTLEKADGFSVPVGVWAVTEADEARLDRYEGYPAFYYKKDINVELKADDGPFSQIEAFVYIMHEDRKLSIPSSYYMQTCLEGYDRFGFDKRYLLKAFIISKEGM